MKRIENSNCVFVELSDNLKQLGIYVKPYKKDRLTDFYKLDVLRQIEVYSQLLQINRDVLTTIHKKEEELGRNHLNYLWSFLNEKKIRYPSDLFLNLSENDIIEVYDVNNIQIYRSYEFFKYCDYSIEEIFSTPWYELYHRDSEIIEQYLNLLQRGMQGQLKGIIPVNIPAHMVIQVKSPNQSSHCIKSKIVCFLNDSSGNVSGYIHSQNVLH